MIEPAGVDELGLPCDTLEMKAQAANNRQARIVGGRCRAANPVHPRPKKRELKTRGSGLGHITVAAGLLVQPIAKFARAVKVHTIVEATKPIIAASASVANDESAGRDRCPNPKRASACEAWLASSQSLYGTQGNQRCKWRRELSMAIPQFPRVGLFERRR